MKRKRLLALLISAVLIAQPTTYVLAEKNQSTNDVENSVNEESEDEAERELETKKAEKAVTANGLNENGKVQESVAGYIPSELDNNVPVYVPEIETYSNEELESKYPANGISDIRTRYPAIRNQNPYGTCWAFSSMGLAEFDMINDGSVQRDIDLSELQLAYFTYNSVVDPIGGTEGDYSRYYVENSGIQYGYLMRGGNYIMASRRLGQWVGAVNETDVPYSEALNVLANGLSDEYAYSKDVGHLENTYLISIKKNPEEVKKQIKDHGAVGVSYSHSDTGYQYINNSYNDISGMAGGGHAVMVVGWDDNYSKDNFRDGVKPENNGAWLIRNSWGESSSYDNRCEYFWMSYETYSLANTAWVFDFSKDDGYDNNYQVDGGLNVGTTGSYSKVANVFTVQNKQGVSSEELKAISCSFTSKTNVGYTIDIYTDLTSATNPFSGTKQEEATTTGTTTYAGVYTIPLENTVNLKPGTSFSVVVTTNEPAIDFEYVERTEINENKEQVWDVAVSSFNHKSFHCNSYGNAWEDPYGRNYCIKAFTSNDVETKHSINYELNGGTNNSENQETYTSGNGTIVLKDPTREGCIFEGWYTDKDYTNKITEIPANAAQDYTLYAKWSSVTGEKLAGYNLNLDGTIGVNFFVELPNNVVVSKDAYMEFTLPNGDKSQVSVEEAKKSGSYYIFTARVKAQEMTKDIKAKMVVGNQSGKVYTYSVKQYADYILNHTNAYTEAGVKVVKGLLNYGAATQQLFSYNLDNLANESMSDSDKLIEDVDFSQYKYSVINDPDVTGIKYYGSLLNLNTSTNVKNYFRLDEDHSIDEYQFSYKIGNEEKEVAPVLSEQQGVQCYLIEIKDVKAYNLDQQPVVIIRMKNNEETEGMQLIYGAFSYAEAVSRLSTPNENLVNLTKALYWYWYGARLYADEQNK